MKKPSRILVVDDTADIRALCEHILKGAGYEVQSAMNGRQAVEMLKDYPADLIMMDIMMPSMDGLTACEAIRSDPATRNIPVVFMSAVSNLQTLAPRVIRLATAVVAKPFDMDVLLDTVKRLAPP
ncbi:MAG TPA: response regulator [Chloroflexia bacterium]|nr:response regulator [Chloroflexia bacterium]